MAPLRYPTDAAKFNGRVFIEHPECVQRCRSGGHLAPHWQYLMTNGYGYVGITSKSLTADALKKFDATRRYTDVNWKVGSANEDGLFWNMLSQLGTALRQPGDSASSASSSPSSCTSAASRSPAST